MTVEVVPNAYRNDGPWPLSVAPGRQAKRFWSLAKSGNWYDFTVIADTFEHRFAGRVETGVHSISDPTMADGQLPAATIASITEPQNDLLCIRREN